LTNFGAKVLHPSTLWPVMRSNTKVFVGSTFSPHKGGTYIYDRPKNKKTKVRAITERKSQSLIKVKFANNETPNMAYSIFLILQKHGISTDIVNLTETSFSFIISQSEDFIEQLMQDLNRLTGVTLYIEQNLSLTAVVGNSLDKAPKLLNKILKSTNISNIKLSGYGANGSSLYMLTDGKKNVQKVYKALF
jgi:aspartate kinase